MSTSFFFATNDTDIRVLLTYQMHPHVSQYTGTRESLSHSIPADLCRNIDNLIGMLKHMIMDPDTTVIFAMNYSTIIGMIVFKKMKLMNQDVLKIEYVCVSPQNANLGVGSNLINYVKNLADKMRLHLYLQSIRESSEFYVKKGFVNQGSDFYLYTPTTLTYASNASNASNASHHPIGSRPALGGSKSKYGKSKRRINIKIKSRRHASKSKSNKNRR